MRVLALNMSITERKLAAMTMEKTDAKLFPLSLKQRDVSVGFHSKGKKRTEAQVKYLGFRGN